MEASEAGVKLGVQMSTTLSGPTRILLAWSPAELALCQALAFYVGADVLDVIKEHLPGCWSSNTSTGAF